MDIRWTKRIDSAYEIANAGIQGFDGVEASLSALMELDEADLAVYRTILKESKLSCEVIESILPAEVGVTERGFDIYSWTEYLRLASRSAPPKASTASPSLLPLRKSPFAARSPSPDSRTATRSGDAGTRCKDISSMNPPDARGR